MLTPKPPYLDRLLGNDRVKEFAAGTGFPEPAGLAVYVAVRIDRSERSGSASLAAYSEHVRLSDALAVLDLVQEMRAERTAHLRQFPAIWEGFQKREATLRIREHFGLLNVQDGRVFRPDGRLFDEAGRPDPRLAPIDIEGTLAIEQATPRERDMEDLIRARNERIDRECQELVRRTRSRDDDRSLEF